MVVWVPSHGVIWVFGCDKKVRGGSTRTQKQSTRYNIYLVVHNGVVSLALLVPLKIWHKESVVSERSVPRT